MSDIYTRRDADPFTIIEFVTPSLLDPAVLEDAAQTIYKIIDDERRHRFVLDFSKVVYLSSQAIGIVLAMNRKLSGLKDSKLILCGLRPKLMDLINITRLDRVLTIKPTLDDALGSLAK